MANPMYGQNKADDNISQASDVDKNFIHTSGSGLIIPGRHMFSNGTSYADADPYSESATQLFPLGTTLDWGDRVFKYCQSNGGTTAGLLVQGPPHVANHTNNLVTNEDAPASGAFSHAAGSKKISIDTAGDTDLTLNQYAEGYLVANDAEGQGQVMRIKSHPAHDHGVDPSVVITTYDPLATTLVKNSSQLSLVPNPYSEVITSPATTPTSNIVGVANIDMTDDYYAWIQVRGPRAVLASASDLVIGNAAYRSVTDAGGVIAGTNDAAGAVAPYIGEVMASGIVDTEYVLIWLNIM